jgi:hypothetical protein
MSLNENQKRHLLTSFMHIDQLIAAARCHRKDQGAHRPAVGLYRFDRQRCKRIQLAEKGREILARGGEPC